MPIQIINGTNVVTIQTKDPRSDSNQPNVIVSTVESSGALSVSKRASMNHDLERKLDNVPLDI